MNPDEPDLLTLLEEQEKGPLPCPHVFRVGKTGHGWRHQTDPARPYFLEYVHADPRCMRSARPGHSIVPLPTVGWSRELQRDVAPKPCAFCVGTHPADLDHCICGRWDYAQDTNQATR